VAVAYFIVLEKKIENLNGSMDGKMLARASEVLDDIATRHGARPLTGFTSIDPVDAGAFFKSEGIEMENVQLPPLQQFTAEEGLATVKALITHLQLQPTAVRNIDALLQELRDCERILIAARDLGVKWHFEVNV